RKGEKWWEARADDLTQADREFIARSIKHRRLKQTQAAAAVLGLIVVVGLVVGLGATGWQERDYWQLRWQMWFGGKPLALTVEAALKPGEGFQECGRCPQMVVVPAGKIMVGTGGENDSGGEVGEGRGREKPTVCRFQKAEER